MDKAGLLLPERAAALNAELMAGAREYGIWIYVLTLPTLSVNPSQKHENLARLAHRYADLWTKDQTAMIILFDDESRDAIVVASDEANRRFPPFTRNLVLTEPLATITQGPALTREKMEQAAKLTLDILVRLQAQERAGVRRQRIVNSLMTVFFTTSGGLLLYLHLRKRRPAPASEP